MLARARDRKYDPGVEGAIQDRPLTVEDLYVLPDDGRRYELQAGRLLSEPLPGTRHGLVVSIVDGLLSDHVRSHGLGVVLAGDTGFILGRSPDTVRGPDIAFVCRERFESVGAISTAFPGAPDVAIEILSPNDRAGDIHAKVADYLAAGTRLVWVVDPVGERVTVYRALLEPRVLERGNRLEGEDVVPGFGVPVAALFS